MGRFVVKNAHSFLLLSLCSLIGAVLYWSCITGRQFLVFHGDIGTDTYLSYWAYDRYFYNLFKSRSFSFWSFCVGLGSQVNWLPKFLNPLHQLLYLGGEDRILYMYSIKALLASIFAAFFWFRYLKYFKVRDSIAVVFSIYYGFSGFVTLWGQHQFNHIAYVLFPIILYALELLFKENKPLLYSLALSYLYIVSWHNGVCLSVFLLIYAVYRLYEEFGFSKKALIAFFKFAGFSVVSVGIGVVNLLVEYDVLSSTIRLTSRAYKHRWLFESAYYKTFLARLFSNNLTGNPLHGYFGTWNYYEDPQVYCGLLTLVFLLPILLKGSKKYATTLFLLTCVAFIVLPDLTASFMLFTKVSSRQSFILILALLTIVPRRLNTLEEELNDSGSRIFLIMMPVLLALLAVCTFCLIVPDFRNRFSLVRSDLPDVLCFLGAYWLVLLVMRHRNLSTILTVMLPLVCIEVILLNWSAVNHRRSLTSIPSSSDLQGNRYIYAGAFDFLKQREEGKGFSRFYLPSVDIYSLVNMPSYYFYPGQTTYNSFIDKSNFDFYKSLGVDGIQHSSKVLIGMKDRFILHSLLGTKYFLSPDEINYPGVRFVKEVDGVNIFENPYAVPLGVVYQNCISTHDWLKLSPAQREALLTEVVVLDGCLDTKGDHLKQLETKLVDIPHSMQHLIDTGIVGYLRGSEIRASANLEKAGTAVFSIPFNKGWRAWVNDKEQEIVRANGGLIGLPLSAGNVEIVLSFRPPHLKVGVAVSLISLILLFWLGFRGRQHPFGK